MSDIKLAYEKRGFHWTTHLENLMRIFAGASYDYPHYIGDQMMEAEFYDAATMLEEADNDEYRATAKFLNEDVVPVGWCEGGVTDLLLTASGNLVGFNDYLLLSWSSHKAPNWKDAIERLFNGSSPQELGLAGRKPGVSWHDHIHGLDNP